MYTKTEEVIMSGRLATCLKEAEELVMTWGGGGIRMAWANKIPHCYMCALYVQYT